MKELQIPTPTQTHTHTTQYSKVHTSFDKFIKHWTLFLHIQTLQLWGVWWKAEKTPWIPTCLKQATSQDFLGLMYKIQTFYHYSPLV